MTSILKRLFSSDPHDPPEQRRIVRKLVAQYKASEYGRGDIVQAIAALRCTSATNFLIGALDDDDDFVRVKAADALKAIGDQRAIAPLLKRLTSEHSRTSRSSIVLALGVLKATSAAPTLRSIIKDEAEHSFVRGDAIDALTSIEGVQAVPLLEELLASKDSTIHHHAAQCISSLGVLSETIETRVQVAIGTDNFDAIGNLGPEALLVFETLARNGSGYLKLKACEIIGKYGTSANMQFAVDMLYYKDRDWSVENFAQNAVERIARVDQPRLANAISAGLDRDHNVLAFLCTLLNGYALEESLARSLADKFLEATSKGSRLDYSSAVLTRLLQDNADKLSIPHLDLMRALPDRYGDTGGDLGGWHVSFQTVRDLAAKEMVRRNQHE